MKHWEIAPQTSKTLQDFTTILQHWQWFRERCLRFHGVEGLPETFGEQDGTIQQHQWVDPEEDWTAPPPEYNHDWRTQDLLWYHGAYCVSFTRNDDIYTNSIRFELKNPAEGDPTIYIKLRLSQHSKGEAILQGTPEHMTAWENEIRLLTSNETPRIEINSNSNLCIQMKHWEIAPQKDETLQEAKTIQRYWRWFRARCMRFYNIEDLPETFGEQDGTIQQHQGVDPKEDRTAPPTEYNHDWRTQNLLWKHGAYRVSFTRNDDIHANSIRFELKSPIEGEPTIYITLRLSQHSKGEAILQDIPERITSWENEIRLLTRV
jgi:hypothetical protein